jgi:hypothetical protein
MKTFSVEQKRQIIDSFCVRFIENINTTPIFVTDKQTISRFLEDFIWEGVRCYTKPQLIHALTTHKIGA